MNIEYQDAFESLNSVLMPPNPFQDILEMQVSTYQRTGALMDESLLNVINENRQSLLISAEAEELLALSLDKVTEQKERLEAARREVIAAEQLSALAALQHRINNTFNLILPNITRLKSRVDMSDPTIVEILDIIERNSRYTSRIISSIQEPLKEVQVEDVNINILLEELVGRFSRHESYSKISLKTTLDNTVPTIRAVSGQLAEVFENLIDNALKAMPNGGELQIIGRLEDQFVCIYFKDTGGGIPEGLRESLFDKPLPAKYPGGGAGLGLWLSRLILQSMGGDVSIEKSDLMGTTMLVKLQVR